MGLIYLFDCVEPLFCAKTEHADAFVQSWYGFKLSQPITNSNFHFLFIVQSVTSLLLVQQLKLTVYSNNRTVRPPTQRIVLRCYHLDCWTIHTVLWGTGGMRKWQWLFVDGSENQALIFAAREPRWGKCLHFYGDHCGK